MKLIKNTKDLGNLGEDIAVKYLLNKGFYILERNYRSKAGEIDIICKDVEGVLHFIEVKTVSHKTYLDPEENVTNPKIKKIERTIYTYFSQNGVSQETDWQIDVVAIYLDRETKKAHIKYLPSVFIE